MIMTVTKLGAARSQLIEAIHLFFERRDPVSIHTLVGATLQILHDHFQTEGEVWDASLIFHYDSIYIKDEFRTEWIRSVREPRNFFKHAEEDLKEGKEYIEFNIDDNIFQILEAIHCMKLLEVNNWSYEFRLFFVWFGLNYPHLLKKDDHIKNFKHISSDDFDYFHNQLKLIQEMPEEVKKFEDGYYQR